MDGGLPYLIGRLICCTGSPKAVSSFPIDTHLGPELLYQFFIKTSYFLFMILAGSLKMALPVGDTARLLASFYQVVRVDMNILIERKSRAFNKLNLFWNLSDRFNRGAKKFSIISPASGIRNTTEWTGATFPEGPQGAFPPLSSCKSLYPWIL